MQKGDLERFGLLALEEVVAVDARRVGLWVLRRREVARLACQAVELHVADAQNSPCL